MVIAIILNYPPQGLQERLLVAFGCRPGPQASLWVPFALSLRRAGRGCGFPLRTCKAWAAPQGRKECKGSQEESAYFPQGGQAVPAAGD